jgi:membrane protein
MTPTRPRGVKAADAASGRHPVRALVGRYKQTRERFDRTTPGRLYRRGVAIDLVNHATILAALAFLVMVPALITVSAVMPLGAPQGAGAQWAQRLGLSAEATRDLQALLPPKSGVRGGTTALGVVLTVVSAFAWPKELQRGYELVWDLPILARGVPWRRWVWLVTFILGAAVSGASARFATGWVRVLLLVAVGVPLATGWSWWTQHLLLDGRVPWRRLLPGAIATGVGLIGLRLVAGVHLSTSITQHFDQYGALGVAFTLLTWLVVLDVILLGGPLAGAVLADHTGLRSSSQGPPVPVERGAAAPCHVRQTNVRDD